ncbi:cardiac-enriched FHL2-interacting protein [Erinaceus europaeus]|uniref:Cardiac-enriched FHL2-interacting protein n=1 Tax=Erinaceus europaeus TaxID=9365 RepID=A0A1S2ZYH6_ERIEU|nr:cardiac-enriched FHL2-interacting protein [Erinaceus europaeus]XP_060047457.1 cardiac-enriched FHL2-interacting protein [Erinaceus europaeus]XP_060047468.1 cardiac-enriched FHL2-interacting protein [Erinaceus europaeus]XP_060047479.1 cardiac-enriched FHL2-interacting protein [Erinaceus europaeus]XP_060047484.1 cardiac-enriched FHL2-interacting protein [Erinaceus europaeus]XP_060047492.1 cardiac-enriched FHL2-interacting protein [Erinaceus europaeus]
MQGNKKCTDGFSDTSSIGSVLDDADREVSSLTDRAFRSLCISEDTSFNDSDPALSPDVTHHVFGNFHSGTVSHTQRKSGIWSQLPSQGTEHAGWAATLQQQPKYVQGEEKYPKSSPPLMPAQGRLEVPISGLRSSTKPISKVSSLIKSFDSAEGQHCDSRSSTSKPPALRNPPKFAPLPDNGVNFCFDSAFLTVRRVPAEVSSTHQNSHQPVRKHGEQETPRNPESACHGSSSFLPSPEDQASSFGPKFPSPPHKPGLSEPGLGKERTHKGTFLHSENSAFESWNAHQPRLLERKDRPDTVTDIKVPKHYKDTPSLLRDHHVPQRQISPSQIRAGCSQEEHRLVGRALSTSGHWGSQDPGPQIFSMEGQASGSQHDPQLKPSQAPWRKPKTSKGGPRGKESQQDASDEKKHTGRKDPVLYTKHNPQGKFPENEALDMPVEPNEHYNPPFNISKLLTPVIPTKHNLDSDSQPVELSPSPPGQLNGYHEKEPSEGQSRDSYKSKAPSLLFNLKDVRKCVKSTYSPSPLLKGLDDKTRGKQETMTNGIILPNGHDESPLNEPSKERPADNPSTPHINTQQDPESNSDTMATDHNPNVSSLPTKAKAPFYVNGEAADGNCYDKDDNNGESDMDVTRPSWGSRSKEHSPKKNLSLKLCSRESEIGVVAENQKIPELENEFLRSVSQEEEPGREARLQNPNFNQKFSPGPLSPEEEDVFYSDSQSDFMPSLKSKAKFSTSSSDQSFASFEDQQQKMWFTESQQEGKKNDVSAGDSQKDEENIMGKDEPQYGTALSNGHTYVEELSQKEPLQGEGGSLSRGRTRKASSEEANFRASQVGASKEMLPSHAKDLIPSLSAAANKHPLFAIKDNTLRATPVIKPILLPLLKAMSSEDLPGGGHKEGDLPKPGWHEDAGLCAPESQVVCGTPTSASMRGTPYKRVACEGVEDHRQVPSMARMETCQSTPMRSVPSPLFLGEDGGARPPPAAIGKEVENDGKSISPGVPRPVPTITLPEGHFEDQPPPPQVGTCWEEQRQDFQSHFLSAPRTGPHGRRLAPSEAAVSPNASSLEESSLYSPAASIIWDEASQAPSELGLPPEEPPHTRPWASPGLARASRREDLTHTLVWEAGCDPQLEAAAEDLRMLSPRNALLEAAASSVGLTRKQDPPLQTERTAGKPPAVPPKTEKALRRAKKLASKRRKTEQIQEKEPCEEKPHLQNSEHRPLSPRERPQPRFPAVRSLPPPMHRHSVSTFSEPIRRRSRTSQALTPLPTYPATQKVLQDPQSGEYFVFDLPLQVKIKTFYDPETGKYVKVSIPTSEGGSPESPPPDTLSTPYVLYPGFRALPVTALTPLRCSSQLSAPTFLNQDPLTSEAVGPRVTSMEYSAGDELSDGPPQRLGEAEGDAPDLSIISTNDLEDFASEGIS